MITKTNKFRVKINTPWIKVGEVFHNPYVVENPEEYPDVFEPIYTLEDGVEVCIGDLVWRSKNYEVKSVKFSDVHINNDTPIFGKRISCENWLEKNATNIKAELLKQNRSSSFQTLKVLVNKLDKIDNLTISEIKGLQEAIKQSINNIERGI